MGTAELRSRYGLSWNDTARFAMRCVIQPLTQGLQPPSCGGEGCSPLTAGLEDSQPFQFSVPVFAQVDGAVVGLGLMEHGVKNQSAVDGVRLGLPRDASGTLKC